MKNRLRYVLLSLTISIICIFVYVNVVDVFFLIQMGIKVNNNYYYSNGVNNTVESDNDTENESGGFR